MNTKTWTIGSDASCDLVVPNKIVSGKHCRLTVNDGRLTLTDLGSTNGTFVNAKRLEGSMVVSTSHRITLGTSLAMPWPKEIIHRQRAAQSPKRPDGASPRKRATKIITIGRADDNSIVLEDSSVSNHHARLIIAGNQILLEDLGSTNGTAVGQMENNISRAKLGKQDTVFFGTVAFQVSQLLNFRQAAPEASPLSQASTPLFSGLPKLPLVFAGFGMAAAVAASWLFFRNFGSSDQQLARATNASREATEERGERNAATNIAPEREPLHATPAAELEPARADNIVQKTEPPSMDDTTSEYLNEEAPAAVAESDLAIAMSDASPNPATPSTVEKLPGFRMWRISAGQVVSAKLLEHGTGQALLQREDGSELNVSFDRMNPEDIDYLRGIIWPDAEEMSFHEALEQAVIRVRTEDYAHDCLQIIVSSDGLAITPRIRIASGIWVQLDKHPQVGRLYLATKKRGALLPMNKWRQAESSFCSVGDFPAIPMNWEQEIPVIESYLAENSGTKIIHVGHSPITVAGFDPLAANIMTIPTSVKFKNDVVMSQAAALWLTNRPDLKLSTFQAAVKNIFLNRMTTNMKRALSPARAKIFERRNAWNPTIDHLKMGQHLLERAKFELAMDEKVATTGKVAGDASGTDVASTAGGASNAVERDTLTLVEALDADVVTVAGRKGLDGRVIITLTRSETAPAGPMHVKISVGTVLLVDDGKPEPVKCYPLCDQRIDLFGPISGGAQVPVLYGSYKRKFKTTKELPIHARYDSKIADLFAERPPAHHPQMAVEAVLLDQPELNCDQVQYHLSLTGVPVSEADSAPEPVQVTEALLAAARLRIAGDNSAITPEIASPSSTKAADVSNSSMQGKRPSPRNKPSSQTDGNKNPLQVADQSPHPSTAQAGDPPELDLYKPEDRDRARELLAELNKHVPESPEDDLLGTWVTVPDKEAREIAETLMLNYYKRAAIAQGKTLSDEELGMLTSKVKQDLRGLRVLTGSIEFEINDKGLKRYHGNLSCRNPSLSINPAGSWHLAGNGFSMGRSGGAHYSVERLEYAANGCLAQVRTFVGGTQGVTFGVLALEKVK
ncbi:MAG: FHA domain-containing protein [Planctomycetaceae bacterium]